ncbi:sigma-54 interaction domain-containing protein [Gemmatimonadota bacterium]
MSNLPGDQSRTSPHDETVLLAIEHPDIREALDLVSARTRIVVLDSIDQITRYAGSRPVDLVMLPDEIDGALMEGLKTALRTESAHGQILLLAPGGLARLTEQGPWRGVDAPPPPPEDDLQEIITALLEFSRVGRLTGLLGESEAIASVLRTVSRIAGTDVPILIRGPSGTGKELIARGIHRASARSGKPFVAVNTPGLSESLIESELFGHEKGAFTGAMSRKEGVFEAAGEGTIFLDEIGDLSKNLQSKLLRVLEEHEFQRVGGTGPISVRARVLAATNVELERAVEEGRFREDLYYRLQVVTIEMPPLRDRVEDVVPLLKHFVTRVCTERGTTFVGFTDDAILYLQRYSWPGNVRELRNLVEQVVLVHPGEKISASLLMRIFEERTHDPRNLPTPTGKTPDQVERELIFQSLQALREEVADLRASLEVMNLAGRSGGEFDRFAVRESGRDAPGSLQGSVTVPLGVTLEEIEVRLIEETLRRLKGDKKKTAEALGIGLRTLYRRLEKLEEERVAIQDEDFQEHREEKDVR